MSVTHKRRFPQALTAVSSVLALVLSACQAPGLPQPPSARPELEGPQGQVAQSGPWLLKALIPSPRPETPIIVLVERWDEGSESWQELTELNLIESSRARLWLGALPELSAEEAIRYRLPLDGSSEQPWREVTWIPDLSREEVPVSCELSFLQPRESQRLSAEADDIGQPAGLQYPFEAYIVERGPDGRERDDERASALKLTVNINSAQELSHMSLTERGLAAFPSVSLNAGVQRARLEGFSPSGAYCVTQLLIEVD